MITLFNPVHKITRTYDMKFDDAVRTFKDDIYMLGYIHWKCVEVLSIN